MLAAPLAEASPLRSKSRRSRWRVLAAIGTAIATFPAVHAGPPFLTDDPDPVELNHWEFYVFGQGDRAVEANAFSGPAVELNYGVAPDTQLHLIAPVANIATPGAGWTAGYGDTEVGIKYRFLAETAARPEFGVFPLAELATGSGTRGLGNGKTWYQFPLWGQKSWGPWTVDGGGGLAINAAAGQRDHGYGGGLVQRDLGKYLTLGAELFGQGADQVGGQGFVLANLGGTLKFSESFNLLFSAGRSVSGERHTVWYLGFYWTGGPAQPEKK